MQEHNGPAVDDGRCEDQVERQADAWPLQSKLRKFIYFTYPFSVFILFLIFYFLYIQILTDKRTLAANLNRDKAPKEMLQLQERDKTPTATTYKVEKIEERNFLSNKPRVYAFKYGDREIMRHKKYDRFIDTEMKSKQWVPAPSKYLFPVEKMAKCLSKGPRSLSYNFKKGR